MIAYRCGARLYREAGDVVAGLAMAQQNLGSYLEDRERDAYLTLLPGTWWAMWWRGWNDEAAKDAAEGASE